MWQLEKNNAELMAVPMERLVPLLAAMYAAEEGEEEGEGGAAWQDVGDDGAGEDDDGPDDFDYDDDEKMVGPETKARVARLFKAWAASGHAQKVQACVAQLPHEQQQAVASIFK